MLRGITDVPVIIATARDDEGEIVRLLNDGADDYLIKPFSVEHLAARIGPCCGAAAGRAPSTGGRRSAALRSTRPARAKLDGAARPDPRGVRPARLPGRPAAGRSSPSGSCWPRSGSSRTAATRPSTSTCPGCAASSARPRPSPATCTPCAASASSWSTRKRPRPRPGHPGQDSPSPDGSDRVPGPTVAGAEHVRRRAGRRYSQRTARSPPLVNLDQERPFALEASQRRPETTCFKIAPAGRVSGVVGTPAQPNATVRATVANRPAAACRVAAGGRGWCRCSAPAPQSQPSHAVVRTFVPDAGSARASTSITHADRVGRGTTRRDT